MVKLQSAILTLLSKTKSLDQVLFLQTALHYKKKVLNEFVLLFVTMRTLIGVRVLQNPDYDSQ